MGTTLECEMKSTFGNKKRMKEGREAVKPAVNISVWIFRLQIVDSHDVVIVLCDSGRGKTLYNKMKVYVEIQTSNNFSIEYRNKVFNIHTLKKG